MSCFGLKKKPLEQLCDAVLIDDCQRARSLIDSGAIVRDAEARSQAAPPDPHENEEARKRRQDAAAARNDCSIDGYRFMRELPEDESGRGGGFFTPLHLAAYIGSPEMCHVLLERGADVNARTKRWRFLNTTPYAGYGWFTPLHIAAERGHASVVCKLMQRDATQGFRTQRGLTAVQLASEEVKMLLQNDAEARRRAKEMDEQLGLGPEPEDKAGGGNASSSAAPGAGAGDEGGRTTPPPLVVKEADANKGKDTPAKADQSVDHGKGKENAS